MTTTAWGLMTQWLIITFLQHSVKIALWLWLSTARSGPFGLLYFDFLCSLVVIALVIPNLFNLSLNVLQHQTILSKWIEMLNLIRKFRNGQVLIHWTLYSSALDIAAKKSAQKTYFQCVWSNRWNCSLPDFC